MCHLSHMQHSRGFTLVELVIGIVLIGILSVVSTSMIADSFTTTRIVDASQVSAAQARYAIERIAREIRETQYQTFYPSTYVINTFTATQLVFTKSNNVTVTINKSGSNLTLGYSSPATTSLLTNQVGSFALAYYDIFGAQTNNVSAIRFVQVSLTVTDPSGQGIAQRTRIALRNGA